MTLASMSLAFYGHCEQVSNDSSHRGKFLELVAMQTRFDPVLQDLLRTTARQVKCQSATIQNELIQLISNDLLNQLISRIKACPFYSIIVYTTSDQVSIVVRWVWIASETVTIKEIFLGLLT